MSIPAELVRLTPDQELQYKRHREAAETLRKAEGALKDQQKAWRAATCERLADEMDRAAASGDGAAFLAAARGAREWDAVQQARARVAQAAAEVASVGAHPLLVQLGGILAWDRQWNSPCG